MTIQTDTQYLEAGVPQLESYLLSKELYYPIGLHLPQLTLGGVLLAMSRAGRRAAPFQSAVDGVRLRWGSAWEAKAGWEVRARGELWMQYLAEYREDHQAGVRLYTQNVRYRAMLTLLGQSAHESDGFVKSVFIGGKFVWEEECAENFSRESFWYLYGTLKE